MTGGAWLKDDVPEIIDKMIAADVVVLSTPVYFYCMNAWRRTVCFVREPRSKNETATTPKEETTEIQTPIVAKTGPKSILIISSSPRRGGNSETLCKQFMKAAEESGHTVEMLNLNDYDIKFFAKQEYVRGQRGDEDDAIRIIKKMAAADVIVLSTPTYFYSMSGQMKVLIDRVYNYEKDLKEKEFYYIVTSTDKRKRLWTALLRDSGDLSVVFPRLRNGALFMETERAKEVVLTKCL